MIKFIRIFFATLLMILLAQATPVGAEETCKTGDLWLNFATGANDKRCPPELKISTNTTPGSQTTLISYKIFGCRQIPVLLNNCKYSRLEVADCGFTSDPGDPKLPVKTIFLEFPDNHDYNVTLVGTKTIRIKDISLLPSQPAPPEIAEPAFIINQQIYQNNAYYPAERILRVKTVQLRQRRLLEIRLTPVRFHPLQREVDFAYEIKLQVTFMAVGDTQ